jgi:hypothetical protein
MPSTWAETNEVITRNRRIGISMTGIVDFIENRSWSDMQYWMDEGYKYLENVDTKYSEWLGVRNSVKLTTVKPAGTTSIIAGTTSGVHWPTTSGYYIRRIRFHKTDPLLPILKKAGYHIEDDVMDSKTTAVASFPTKGLEVRSELEVSIWEKASLAAMAQRYWADNMVSVTVSFKPDSRQFTDYVNVYFDASFTKGIQKNTIRVNAVFGFKDGKIVTEWDTYDSAPILELMK